MGLQDDMKTLLAMDAQAQKETFTPSHPFTPDAWAFMLAGFGVAGATLRQARPARQRFADCRAYPI